MLERVEENPGIKPQRLMAATVQNLKKLAQQRFKPSDHKIGAPVYR
jgi:hypothetical protein